MLGAHAWFQVARGVRLFAPAPLMASAPMLCCACTPAARRMLIGGHVALEDGKSWQGWGQAELSGNDRADKDTRLVASALLRQWPARQTDVGG